MTRPPLSTIATAILLVWVAGCAKSTEPAGKAERSRTAETSAPPGDPTPARTTQQITLHVEGVTKIQGIT